MTRCMTIADLEVDALLTLDEADEVTGDDTALMDELIERVLPVGAWLAEIDLASLERQLLAID